MRVFSDRDRPVHLGPFPAERLDRGPMPDLAAVRRDAPLAYTGPEASIVHAMRDHAATLDAIRDGLVARVPSAIPVDPRERANHLLAFAHFNDAALAGTGPVPREALLAEPRCNRDIERLAADMRTRQTKTLAAGIDAIMADLKESMDAPPSGMEDHSHALVLAVAWHRDPRPDEPGFEWIEQAQPHRAALLAAENAVVLANYLRVLGHRAKAHSATASDVDLQTLAVAAGLATPDGANPFLGHRYGLAAVTTTLELAHDRPLAATQRPSLADRARWWTGYGTRHSAGGHDPYARRDYASGPHPFERLARVDEPTTYIDEANVARVPKRTDMFARAQFGDMGKTVQKGATRGHYVNKAAPSAGQRRALGAFVLLQDGEAEREPPVNHDPAVAAASVKAASHFLGADAVGLSRCPPWAWYSHDAAGEPIDPPHDQAVSMIVDQGFETMEGASGDDWISVAQSMRAYLRFSLVGGVVARQIRRMGWPAKAHTVLDGEVLQPPLLLLSGLGEVSRIGEVILNPYLGPRLKSGVVTTTMPMAHDRPIDFGLQRFCEGCNKCARECPSGAITAGPKLMFNGYEIWKSDSQKCATYRITTPGGAMCGRCMKTCPWNLEGLFAEAPFRWAAMNVPAAAPYLAKLDDAAGRGGLNPVKKWWWDLELQPDGAYRQTEHRVNRRDLQTDLDLRYEDQTLAVYPANLAPHPHPYPFPMDREAGIRAYRDMVGAQEYRARSARGEDGPWRHRTRDPLADGSDAPVEALVVAKVERPVPDVALYTLAAPDGRDLPPWEAGAHLDIVVAPEFLRQYSMCGDPADRSRYRIAVLNERGGRGGSELMHRIFAPGRRVFVSHPLNHFPLHEDATFSHLMGGGIGVTPMVAMAHRLHALGRPFALHYSVTSEDSGAFLAELAAAPWSANVHFHVSAKGSRADLDAVLAYRPGAHVYTCGPERYMAAVMAAAERAGFPEEARHVEHFAVPEEPPYENFAFTLRLRDGRELAVPADRSAADVLNGNGVRVDVKCSDGICGVCRCGLLGGEVEHRDHVLCARERETSLILCRSRALEPDGIVEIDL